MGETVGWAKLVPAKAGSAGRAVPTRTDCQIHLGRNARAQRWARFALPTLQTSPRRPPLVSLSSQSDKLPDAAAFFFLAAGFFFGGAAAAAAASSASLANRSARSCAVLTRVASTSASYSDIACLASFARCSLANWACPSSFLDLSAIGLSWLV